MSLLEVRHLKLMRAMAQDCNLTRASQRLNLSQSAISSQLKELETRLGTPLFLRVGRGLVITQAGQHLTKVAQQLLSQMEMAELDLQQQGKGLSGVVRISTECYTAYHWLPAVVRHFKKRWPQLQLQLAPSSTRKAVADLLEGQLELVISDASTSHPDLACFPLFSDELLAVLSSAHRLASRSLIRLSDLREEVLYHYIPLMQSETLQPFFGEAQAKTQRCEVVPLTEGILEFVRAGMGFAVLARWAVHPHLRRSSLVGIPLAPKKMSRQWSAVTHRIVADTPWMKDLIQTIARHAPTT